MCHRLPFLPCIIIICTGRTIVVAIHPRRWMAVGSSVIIGIDQTIAAIAINSSEAVTGAVVEDVGITIAIGDDSQLLQRSVILLLAADMNTRNGHKHNYHPSTNHQCMMHRSQATINTGDQPLHDRQASCTLCLLYF
uniref:Putative secreted protein n=1 Tax=Anopheles darlingi TaxID=43151 RepID=A0A2M4DFP9_ANODA